MKHVKIFIERFDPETDVSPHLQEYTVPKEESSTVLEALLFVYERIDSTLAFRYGCRFKNCGLCAIEINDMPRLACTTKLKGAMRLQPLRHLPRIRDLVIDREPIERSLSHYKPYLIRHSHLSSELETFIYPESAKTLENCRECLACLAACPHFHYQEPAFGGPYAFVKLARLYYDPRDSIDRKEQIKSLGAQKCRECRKCRCVVGIPIYRLAIAPFID